MARLLDALAGTTGDVRASPRAAACSRACSIFPVIAPLVTSGAAAFPRVAALTRLLALEPARARHRGRASWRRARASVAELGDVPRGRGRRRACAASSTRTTCRRSRCSSNGRGRARLAARRACSAVLAHVEGDHVDARSLAKLARVRGRRRRSPRSSAGTSCRNRCRVATRCMPSCATPSRAHESRARRARSSSTTSTLLERHPERLELEQTHLFAAMDHAYRKSDMNALLRVNALAERLERAQG